MGDAFDTASQWEANAPAWIEMSRAGADVYRDLVNTPATLPTGIRRWPTRESSRTS